MRILNSIYFYLILGFVNTFLKGTHFFVLKMNLLKLIGIKVGKGTKIVAPIHLGRIVNLEIGENCWINKDFSVEGNGSVCIGNNCDIAPFVTVLTGSHEIGDVTRRAGKGITWTCCIGDGSWIGAKTTLSNNSNVGRGVVIGACSLVTKSCEDNSLYLGIPAKKVKDF